MRLIGRLVSVVVALGLAGSLVSATAVTASATAAPPPGCAVDDKNQNCVHAATSDITALPAPAYTVSFDPRTRFGKISFVAAITPPYHQCPDGGVPYNQIPCSFRGLSVSGRVYQPGATSLLTGSTQAATPTCDFSCPVTISLSNSYRGPGYLIVHFGIGDLINAANDLTGSSYEVAIPLPANPSAGTLHVVKPTVVMTGKVRTATLRLAGHAGVPRTGVGGLMVRVWSTGTVGLANGDSVGSSLGNVEVVTGSTLHLKKIYAGSIAVTVLGWYSAKPATTGSLLHRLPAVKKVKPAASLHLHSAGVPLDATAVVLAVLTPKGNSRVGGALVNKSGWGQYVVVPLKTGAVVAVKAAKGTKLEVFGYASPADVVDDGVAFAARTEGSLERVLGLPDPYSLS